MIPLSTLKTTAITGGISFLVGASAAWYLTADYKENKYQAILAEVQKNAAQALVKAQESAIQIERENNRLAQEIEVQNAQHRKELAELENELRGYVNELGGMYDRYATCGDTPVSANTGTTPEPATAPTGCKLSRELEGLLLSESKRADEAAAYAQTCYNWVEQLREVNK